MNLRAEITTKEQLSEALTLDFERVYAPMELLRAEVPEKQRIIAVPPVFLGGNEPAITAHLRKLREMGFSSALAHTLGHIGLIKSAGLTPHGGFRLNITNSLAQGHYEEAGLADTLCSAEISARSITEMKRGIPIGVMTYGHLPLMVLRRCPVRDDTPCGESGCNALTDRLGNRLRTLCRCGEVEVLNPVALVLSDKISEICADFCVLRFSPGEKPTKTPGGRNFTRGMFNKRVR
jgi:putative protease